ncbi:MAG: GC-type dockerin domain-anchored protein [Phycisphaerales bacterium]
MTVPSGASLTQTAQGTLRSIINGPNLLTNVGRLLVAGSYNAAGNVIVAYQSYSSPAICRPGVLFVEAQGAGASITGGFASTTVPPAPAPLLLRVRLSPPGIYFASTIVGDICALSGNLVPDGQVTTDDLIAYLDVFFTGKLALADMAALGGALGPDGVLTADDIIAYLQSFFEGCP